MARRKPSLLGVVGSALMGLSLLPLLFARGVSAEHWLLGALAALSLFLSLQHSVWAFVPGSLWLLMGAPTIWAIAAWLPVEEWPDPIVFMLVVWLLAYAWGGLGVILGSIPPSRTRPQTDVSAFD
jgi:hypothetical protein